MSIEEAIMGGIVFKGKKDKPKEEEKVKTKAKKATYIRGQHGSGAAKMKADIRKKRASRHKKSKYGYKSNNLCSICYTYVAGCFSNSENGTLVDASLQDNKIV